MKVWVKIGGSAASWVSVDDDPPIYISDLQHAIKSQRPTKFPATEMDDIIIKAPTAITDAIRIAPNELLNFGANRGSPEHPFVVDAPTGISTLNPFIICVSKSLYAR